MARLLVVYYPLISFTLLIATRAIFVSGSSGSSSLISRELWDSVTSSGTPAEKQNNNRFADRDLLRLDLSGEWLCHVSGPSSYEDIRDNDNNDKERSLIPLFQSKPGSPHVLTRVDYDFGEVWHGAKRLLTTLQWKSSRKSKANENNGDRQRVLSVGVEQGLMEEKEYAAQATLEWLNHKGGESTDVDTSVVRTTGRWNFSNGIGSLSLLAPLSTRIELFAKVSCLTEQQTPLLRRGDSARGFFRSRIPSSQTKDEDWWIPDLSLNPMGIAKSQSYLKTPFPSRFNNNGNIGFKLTIGRQIPWNMFGISFDNNNNDGWFSDTSIKMEISCMGERETSITTASLETKLETPLDSTKIRLTHEHAMSL